MHKQKGFTLLEIMLVMVVLIVIFGVSLSAYFSLKKKNDVSLATNHIVQSLERARILSQSAAENETWGVSVRYNEIVLFKGTDYLNRDPNFDEVTTIPSLIETSGLGEVVFSPIKGLPHTSGVFVLTDSNTGEDVSYIILNEKGTLEYGPFLYGVCGSDHEKVLLSTPGRLCTKGFPSPDPPSLESGVWHWQCEGLETGGTVSCHASYGDADFTVSETFGDTPLTVTFSDTSLGTPSGWEWDFNNDGITDSTLQNPQYTYHTGGVYSVNFKAIYPAGTDQVTHINHIRVLNALSADFYALETTGSAPFTAQFYDDSSGDYMHSWRWNFGDGYVASELNPSHIYKDIGTYTVKLTVSNKYNQSDIEEKTSYIDVTAACSTGETNVCDTGLDGICETGTQNCLSGKWGACMQDNEPTEEICSDNIDQDCNGNDTICPICEPDAAITRCRCEIALYTEGYCCDGEWSPVPCTPDCQDGAITSECYCGSETYTEGYCCSGTWQTEACVTECGDGECNGEETCLSCAVDCGVCPCSEGESQTCDTGNPGICTIGTQTCTSEGVWGNCIAHNSPTTEVCSDFIDQDCDGADLGCATCALGIITDRCDCGGDIYSSGYCCFDSWDESSCCGDAVCDGSETCSVCETDCGVCNPPTEEIFYIHPNCTGTSIITGEPYDPGTNCYLSLTDWEATFGGMNFGVCTQGDLVCANKIALVQIEGEWTIPDTNSVTLDEWLTDEDHYIKISTSPDARHDGKWDETAYRIQVENLTALNIRTSHLTIDGLQISLSGTTGLKHGIYGEVPLTNVILSNNIIKDAGQATEMRYGIWLNDTNNNNLKVFNNVIYGFDENGEGGCVQIFSQDGGVSLYSNTVYDCAKGYISGYRDIKAFNNIAQQCTDGYVNEFYGASDYNISDILGDAPGLNSQNKVMVQFMDVLNHDFHLDSTDTIARDGGIALGMEIYEKDIDGETRSGIWFDAGADEFVP